MMDEAPERYYQLIAACYAKEPDQINELNTKSIMLWTNPIFQVIYSLLSYKWLFEHGYDSMEYTVKRFALFLRGANRLFWLDLENQTTTFEPIWRVSDYTQHVADLEYLLMCLSDGKYWRGIIVRKFLSLFDLVSKFSFYYGDKSMDLGSYMEGINDLVLIHGVSLDRPAEHKKLMVRM